jgi:hypothetical protein
LWYRISTVEAVFELLVTINQMKMKKSFTLLLLLICGTVSSQDFEWARNAGLWAYDYGYGIGTDASGNVYVAGKFEMNAEFDSVTVNCYGNHDLFLAKYSPAGQLLWVKTGGGYSGDYAHDMCVDSQGNIYIAGEIDGTATFGNTTVNGNIGSDDALIMKYDSNGNLVWARAYGGASREDARSLALDAAGNIYLIGVFRDTSTIGAYTLIASSQDVDDVFIARLDPAGNVVWVKTIGGMGDDTGRGIDVDSQGNVYAVGAFEGSASFGGAVTLTEVYGNRDLFLSKWDSNGNLIWVKQAGGQTNDVAWDVELDDFDNIYITGEFNHTVVFGSFSLQPIGGSDIFVAKYGIHGNVQWARRFGGELIDRARSIATDNSNVYITGQYGGTLSHGSYTVTSSDSSDIFIASFDADGAPGWLAAPWGPADAYEFMGYEAGTAIHAAGGFVYVTGSYLDGDIFNSTYLSPWTRTDMFVAKIDPSLPSTLGVSEPGGQEAMHAYPNPTEGIATIEFVASSKDKHQLILANALGQVLYVETFDGLPGKLTRKLDLSTFGKGVYLLSIRSAGRSDVGRIVVY